MTAGFAVLRDVAAGRVPANDALLQNCRLDGFGVRAFGREPILDLFRRSPIDLSETGHALESPRALLAVQDTRAIFADVHEGRLTRLWVFGDEALGAPEPTVSVPRDLDLSQSEGDLFFDPADHPDLDPAASDGLAWALRLDRLDALDLPAFSRRAFVVRAFSSGARAAAVVACVGAQDVARRKPFSVNLAVLCDAAGGRVIVDRAGLGASLAQPWTPRL